MEWTRKIQQSQKNKRQICFCLSVICLNENKLFLHKTNYEITEAQQSLLSILTKIIKLNTFAKENTLDIMSIKSRQGHGSCSIWNRAPSSFYFQLLKTKYLNLQQSCTTMRYFGYHAQQKSTRQHVPQTGALRSLVKHCFRKILLRELSLGALHSIHYNNIT